MHKTNNTLAEFDRSVSEWQKAMVGTRVQHRSNPNRRGWITHAIPSYDLQGLAQYGVVWDDSLVDTSVKYTPPTFEQVQRTEHARPAPVVANKLVRIDAADCYAPWIARFQVALSLLLVDLPSKDLLARYALDRSDCERLQAFACDNLRPELKHFASGIGILEAADALADSPFEGFAFRPHASEAR